MCCRGASEQTQCLECASSEALRLLSLPDSPSPCFAHASMARPSTIVFLLLLLGGSCVAMDDRPPLPKPGWQRTYDGSWVPPDSTGAPPDPDQFKMKGKCSKKLEKKRMELFLITLRSFGSTCDRS